MAILETKRNRERCRELFQFTQGIAVDSRLARQEVAVQRAWAKGLAKIGILTPDEVGRIDQALDEAFALMDSGKFEWRVEEEDVHMNLERFVTDRAGALGKKMHAGRSRNDLIATTLRLFVRDSLAEAASALAELVIALVERAEKDVSVIVPGLTHLQNGQPIRHGHALAAHGWAFQRDLERIQTVKTRTMGSMPLGSAALGGTPLPIDLMDVASELGFSAPSANSYDSVGDRDFMLEAMDAFSSVAVHLSRLAEDCIIWSSTAIGLVKLPTAWSTGSSIMPNKRNPDVPELIRGKSAHLIGAGTNGHVLMKGVPTSYGSDLHELKGVFLRSFDEMMMCLSVFPPFIRGLEPDLERARELLKKGHILATEIADELVAGNVPFREAYKQVAALVEMAEAKGVQIQDLKESDYKSVAPNLSPSFMQRLSPEAAVERRTGPGGTSLQSALAGIAELKRRVKTAPFLG